MNMARAVLPLAALGRHAHSCRLRQQPPSRATRGRVSGRQAGLPGQGTDTNQQTAYDTVQYVDASGGQCDGATQGQGVIIITLASQAKETDWLHQNAAMESQCLPDGYAEAVSGCQWVIVSQGYGVFTASGITNDLQF